MRRIHKGHVPAGGALESAGRTTMFQPNRVWARSLPRSLWRRGSVRVGLLAGLAALGTAAGVAVFHAGAPGTAPVTALDAAPPALPPVVWETDEIGRMPAVLLLQAGKSLEMDVAPNAELVQAGGTWEAEFGEFDGNGVYTAPSFTPPNGTDEIRYIHPDGNRITTLEIRVLPNPDIPGSENTPYVQLAEPSGGTECSTADCAGSNTTSDLPTTTFTMATRRGGRSRTKRGAGVVPKRNGKAARGTVLNSMTSSSLIADQTVPRFITDPDVPLQPVPSQPETAVEQPAHFVVVTNESEARGTVADPGQTPPGPLPYVGVMNLPLETAGTDRFYRVPVQGVALASSPLGARYVPGQAPLQFAREAPTVSADFAANRALTDEQLQALGGCSPPGCTKVEFEPVRTSSRSLPAHTTGEFTVTAEIQTALKLIGIKISIGAKVIVTTYPTKWFREQKKKISYCWKGKWVYGYRSICHENGMSYRNYPEWAAKYLNLPNNTAPKWDGWVCDRID